MNLVSTGDLNASLFGDSSNVSAVLLGHLASGTQSTGSNISISFRPPAIPEGRPSHTMVENGLQGNVFASLVISKIVPGRSMGVGQG